MLVTFFFALFIYLVVFSDHDFLALRIKSLNFRRLFYILSPAENYPEFIKLLQAIMNRSVRYTPAIPSRNPQQRSNPAQRAILQSILVRFHPRYSTPSISLTVSCSLNAPSPPFDFAGQNTTRTKKKRKEKKKEKIENDGHSWSKSIGSRVINLRARATLGQFPELALYLR